MDIYLLVVCAVVWVAVIALIVVWWCFGIDWLCEKINIDSDILEIITDYVLTFWIVFPPCVLVGYLLRSIG